MSSWGYDEELIYIEVQPGMYQIKFTFLPHFQKGFLYPDAGACVTYSIELGIMPSTYLNTNLLLPVSPQTALPSLITSFTPTTIVGTRNVSSFNHSIQFSTMVDSLFQASVVYPFMSGGVYFTLKGSNILSPFLSAQPNRTWSGMIAQGVTFFDQVLYPGDYELTLSDKGNYSFISGAKSTPFVLSHNIQVGYVPQNYCDEADKLPADLFTQNGGSKPYGGKIKKKSL